MGEHEGQTVRVFYFQKLVVNVGLPPPFPHNQTSGQYVYSCDGSRFAEYQWTVGELPTTPNARPRVVVWTRDYSASPYLPVMPLYTSDPPPIAQ